MSPSQASASRHAKFGLGAHGLQSTAFPTALCLMCWGVRDENRQHFRETHWLSVALHTVLATTSLPLGLVRILTFPTLLSDSELGFRFGVGKEDWNQKGGWLLGSLRPQVDLPFEAQKCPILTGEGGGKKGGIGGLGSRRAFFISKSLARRKTRIFTRVRVNQKGCARLKTRLRRHGLRGQNAFFPPQGGPVSPFPAPERARQAGRPFFGVQHAQTCCPCLLPKNGLIWWNPKTDPQNRPMLPRNGRIRANLRDAIGRP